MGAPELDKKYSKPNIYSYHDIHDFLNDWFRYLGATDSKFSLRQLAKKVQFGSGQLPGILARKITLTKNALDRISPHLKLNKADLSFLEWLRQLSESQTHEERVKAFSYICRYGYYRGKNSQDINAHKYLTKWYYPVVRELVKWPDFEPDPKWVRKKLGNRIKLTEAKDALNFLLKQGYIKRTTENKIEVAESQITCSGGVYKLAMSEYHHQVLNLAAESIYDTDRDLRDLNAHTFAFPKEQFGLIKDILAEALDKIRSIEVKKDKKNSVYQACLLAFPLAGGESK